MRLEGYYRWELCKNKLSLRGKKSLDRRSSSNWIFCNTSTLWLISKWLLIMAVDQYKTDPCEGWTIMATRIQHRSMRRRLKFGHSYQTYNVDLFLMDANMSKTTDIQCGSMQWLVQNIPLQLERRQNAQWTPRVFILFLRKYDSIHVNRCIEVEHGRNLLITSQWCEPLTCAREITIIVNDSQGTLVHSTECE